jgi:hypothetical protein
VDTNDKARELLHECKLAFLGYPMESRVYTPMELLGEITKWLKANPPPRDRG